MLGCEPVVLLKGPGVPPGFIHCQDFAHTQREITGRDCKPLKGDDKAFDTLR